MGQLLADKYELLRVIGSGGTSVVYEGEHTITKRRVAVKCIDAGLALCVPTVALRFLREARAASAIRHAGLVDVLDAGQEEDGGLYLVLEFLEGHDLEAGLRDGKVSPEDAVRVCIEALDALQAVHEEGFVHRDVKPANIFLSSNPSQNRVRLLDFGIAKRLSGSESVTEITRRGSLLGTLQFMSPEQAAGDEVDRRCDIWGVGATLYYSFARRPPYDQTVPGDLLRAVMYERPPPIKSVAPETPPALASVIDRTLKREPAERYETALELRDALVAALEGEVNDFSTVVLDLADTKEAELPPEARPRSSALPFFAALVVLIVGVGSVLLWRATRPPPTRIAVFPNPPARVAAEDPLEPELVAPTRTSSAVVEPKAKADPKTVVVAKKRRRATKQGAREPKPAKVGERNVPDDPIRTYR